VRWLHGRLVGLFGAPSDNGGNGGSNRSGGGRPCAGGGPQGQGSGRSSQVMAASVLDRVRKMLVDVCGVFGLGELRRQLSLMDADGSSTLDPAELKTGLARLGLYLNNREVEEIFWEFDRDRSGSVSYDEFMAGVRGPLPALRRSLVLDAWHALTGGGGEAATLPLHDLRRSFDCEWYPSVHAWRSGAAASGQGVDPDAVVAAVANYFESTADAGYGNNGQGGGAGGGAGMVTFDAFLQYHWDVSAVVVGDRLFEAVVRNTWHLSP